MLSEVVERKEAVASSGSADVRLAAELAYDSTLVLLCRQLGVQTDLLIEGPSAATRLSTEQALVSVLRGLHLGPRVAGSPSANRVGLLGRVPFRGRS